MAGSCYMCVLVVGFIVGFSCCWKKEKSNGKKQNPPEKSGYSIHQSFNESICALNRANVLEKQKIMLTSGSLGSTARSNERGRLGFGHTAMLSNHWCSH